jgi:hypothetical protein
MRKKTTASLKVLQKAEMPKCGQDSDELVQVKQLELKDLAFYVYTQADDL